MDQRKLSIVLLGVLLVSLLVPVVYAAKPDDGSPAWGQTIRLNPTPMGFKIMGPKGVKITVDLEYHVSGDAESRLFKPSAKYVPEGNEKGVQRYDALEFGMDFHVQRYDPDIKFDLVAREAMTVYVSIKDAETRLTDLVWTEGRITLDWRDIIGEVDNLVITNDGFAFTMVAGQTVDPLIEYSEVAGTYVYDSLDQYAPFITIPSVYTGNASLHAATDYSLSGLSLQDWMLQTQGRYTASGDTVSFDFVLENTREDTTPGLTDAGTNAGFTQYTLYDETATFWEVDVGSTKTNETGVVVRGINSTKVVWDGAGIGEIFHDFGASDLDVSNYTFFNFWFKGNDTDQRIILEFRTNAGASVVRHVFYDTSEQWRRFSVPLVDFVTLTGTWTDSLAAIDRIIFVQPEALAYGGTAYFDRMTFDSPMWTPFEVGVPDNTTLITVSALDSGLNEYPVFVWDDDNGTTTGDVYAGNVLNMEDEFLGVLAKSDASDWTVKDNATLQVGAVDQFFLNTSTWLTDSVDRMVIPADYVNDQLQSWNQENTIVGGNPWSGNTLGSGAISKIDGVLTATQINSGSSVVLGNLLYNSFATSLSGGFIINGGGHFNYVLDTGADDYSYEFYLNNERRESQPGLMDGESAGTEYVIHDEKGTAYWDERGGGGGKFRAVIYNATRPEQYTSGSNAAVYNVTGPVGDPDPFIATRDWAGALDISGYEFLCPSIFLNETLTVDESIQFRLYDTDGDTITFDRELEVGFTNFTLCMGDPDSEVGTFDPTIADYVELIFVDVGQNFTFSVDRWFFDDGQWVNVEMNVPGSRNQGGPDYSYELWGSYLGGGYTLAASWDDDSGVGNPNLIRGNDGTLASAMFGSGVFAGFYRTRGRGVTIIHAFGWGGTPTITYSNNYGVLDRTGFRIKMAPEDSFDSATDGISQYKFKFVCNYDDDGVTIYEFNDDDNQYWGLEHINGSAIVLFDSSAGIGEYLALVTQNDVSALRLVANEDQEILGFEFNVTGSYRVYVDEGEGSETITAPTGETISELVDRWNGYYDNIVYFDRGARAAVDASGEGDAGFGFQYSSVPGPDWKVSGKYPLAPWSNETVWTLSNGRHQALLRAEIVVGDPSSYSYTVDLSVSAEANYVLTLLADFYQNSYNIGPDREAGDTLPMKNSTILFTDPRTATPFNLTYVAQPLQSAEARRDINRIEVNGVEVDSKVIPLAPIIAGPGATQNITVYLGYASTPVVNAVKDANLTLARYSDLTEEMVITMNRPTGTSTVWVDCGSAQNGPTAVIGAAWRYYAANNTVKLTLTHASPRTVTLVWSAQTWALGNQILLMLGIFAMIPLVIGGKGVQMLAAGEMEQDDFNMMASAIVTVIIIMFVIAMIVKSMAGI